MATERTTSVAATPYGQGTVSTDESGLVVPANSSRISIRLTNTTDDDTFIVYLHLGPGDALKNKGIRLAGMGANSFTTETYKGPITAIAAAPGPAGGSISYVEI